MGFGRRREARRNSGPPARGSSGQGAPLRLLLLLMLLLVVLTALALGALLAWRSFDKDVSGKSVAEDSVNSGPTPQLRIANPRGPVRIEGVKNSDSIELEATKYALGSDKDEARKRASEINSDISREGSLFVIETDGGRNTGVGYTLRVPGDSSVEVEAGAGDVSVSGVEGEVMVRAAAGDVVVREARDSVSIEAREGDVKISDVSTDTGRVEAESGVGDLELEDLVVGSLDARVGTGDVILGGRFSGDGTVTVKTGNIVVEVPPEDATELDLEASIGDVVRENER